MRQQSVDPSRAGWVGVAWYCDAVPGVFTLLICMVGRTGEGGLPRAGGGGERRAQSKQEGPPVPAYPEPPGGKWDSSFQAPAWPSHPADGGGTPVRSGGRPSAPHCLLEALRPPFREGPGKEPRAAGLRWVPGHR